MGLDFKLTLSRSLDRNLRLKENRL
ncbi:hypothetical protein C5167_040307 [Papaver somniferum]|uniref:Uncharacterized protein n=1 Tax=Papaver somniferum TaxID=3469 RepID=A0A4Y7IIT5_PAPSO|nr:hypothetical protein C5167_040307 [Papaver somniferum]